MTKLTIFHRLIILNLSDNNNINKKKRIYSTNENKLWTHAQYSLNHYIKTVAHCPNVFFLLPLNSGRFSAVVSSQTELHYKTHNRNCKMNFPFKRNFDWIKFHFRLKQINICTNKSAITKKNHIKNEFCSFDLIHIHFVDMFGQTGKHSGKSGRSFISCLVFLLFGATFAWSWGSTAVYAWCHIHRWKCYEKDVVRVLG